MNPILNILFTPGSFGSTVQTIVQSFSCDYKDQSIPIELLISLILKDGSMHQIPKVGHPGTTKQIEDFCNNIIDPNIERFRITTWIHPFVLNGPDHGSEWLLTNLIQHRINDKFIFIHINDLEFAELNFLFFSFKNNWGERPVKKDILSRLQRLFGLCNVKWDYYNFTWDDLSYWQLRNYFSDGYLEQAQKLIDCKKFKNPDWLVITTEEILNSTVDTFKKVLDYSGGLIPNLEEKFYQFSNIWRDRQQYVINEYELIKKIVYSIQHDEYISWGKLNFVSEAIIQQKLNIRLTVDQFPSNSIDLKHAPRIS